MIVRWFYNGALERENPKLTRWEKMLATGLYKVQQSDNLGGPWSDCKMRDDGAVIRTKPYMRIELKEGKMRMSEKLLGGLKNV